MNGAVFRFLYLAPVTADRHAVRDLGGPGGGASGAAEDGLAAGSGA
jgi:hypothetical protein